jgi:FkbM family methyltransferase
MQRIYFRDLYNDHVGEILKEIFVERLYHPFFAGNKDFTVLDCGANVGLFSYFAAPYSKVCYALEPSKMHFETLSMMVRDNELTNVIPVNVGVSNACKKQTFYHSTNTTAFSLTQLDKAGGSEEVDLVTLEKFVEDYKIEHVDVLKLDVEGEESKILSHSSFDKVCQKIDTILLEHHSWSGVSEDQVKFMLLDRGYRVWKLQTQATVFAATRL